MNELADGCNNTYYNSIGKNLLILIILAVTWETESSRKAPEFKTAERARITKNIFSKGNSKHWPKEIFLMNYVFKTNSWTYTIKDLNKEAIVEAFVKNGCCWVD